MWKQSVEDKRIVTSRAINESQDSGKKDLGVRGEGCDERRKSFLFSVQIVRTTQQTSDAAR